MSKVNKNSEFNKPDINFPMFPLVYAYIESAYIKVKTYQDFVEFIHGCMNQAEVSKNNVRKSAYTSIANALYSIETNVSFESKALEILIEKL